MSLPPSVLQNIADQGAFVPLTDLAIDASRELQRLCSGQAGFRIARHRTEIGVRCYALFSVFLAPDDIIAVMRGAAPVPTFAGDRFGVASDLRMPAEARTATSPNAAVELDRRHAEAFGTHWGRIVGIAARLLPLVERQQDPGQASVEFYREPLIGFFAPLSGNDMQHLRALGEHRLVREFLREVLADLSDPARIPEDDELLYNWKLFAGTAPGGTYYRDECGLRIGACAGYVVAKAGLSRQDIRQRIVDSESAPIVIDGREYRVPKTETGLAFLARLGTIERSPEGRLTRVLPEPVVSGSRLRVQVEHAPCATALLAWDERDGSPDLLDGSVPILARYAQAWWGPACEIHAETHLGLLLAAGLSHGETVATWPERMRLQDGGREQPIGPAQATLLALLRERQILRASFFRSLQERVSREPAR